MSTPGKVIFGVRHHGPGCAASIRQALAATKPDLVLIEGPPDAEAEMAGALAEGMEPPVALLVYRVDNPRDAVFYPFAVFSPEWQALTWALEEKVAVRFMDLPWIHRFARRETTDAAQTEAPETGTDGEPGSSAPAEPASESPEDLLMKADPLSLLARTDGYQDSERWWNDRVEERGDHAGMFAAILEAMSAVREELALPESEEELQREAWMRRCLRQAEKEGFKNIAVVCGAWHAPVLANPPKVAADNDRLKNLPKCKVSATWIPWSHERLCRASGYGAGVASPGWYEHLWRFRADPTLAHRWLIKVARVLRKHDLDASSAHVIEGVRLAETLASLRGRPIAGLQELTEAVRAVLCQGDSAPLSLIASQLIVGQRLGKVPAGLARLPLQQDVEQTQKRLRLKPSEDWITLTLDLREPNALERSHFLHRLIALDIPWGEKEDSGTTKGTFKETWRLKWRPEFAMAIIDATRYGNTVDTAAAARLASQADEDATLENLSELLELALLADLPAAVQNLLVRLANEAARGDDVLRLLSATPPLARLARYGSVRQTDAAEVVRILATFTARIHAGLLTAASGIDDEAAEALDTQMRAYHGALNLVESPAREDWQGVLRRLLDSQMAHPRLAGLAARLLHDAGALAPEETARRLQYALSPGQEPPRAAAWLDGYLRDSGIVLVHDAQLLPLIHAWVAGLNADHFANVLPLLRRSFSSFTPAERAQIASRIARGPAPATGPARAAWDLDATRAAKPLPLVLQLLGLDPPNTP